MWRVILLCAALPLVLGRCGASSGSGENRDGAEGAVLGHDGEQEHAGEVVLGAEALDMYGVRVEEARLVSLRPTFTAPARVGFNAEAMAHVGSPLAGRIIELNVRLGSHVNVGDPLLVVESPDLGAAQSDFLIKRTAAEATGPSVDLARAAWERARGLYESSQGIALTEVQRREAEHRAAIAALKSAQAEAVAAENRLHLLGMSQQQVEALATSGEVNPRLTITAPIDGLVVQREVTLGELVSPEREALLVLADMTTLWVLADVPEARLRDVAAGAGARVRIGGTPGSKYDGTVAFISPMVDAATRTAEVRIEVRGEAMALRPGMFAQVEIIAMEPGGAEPAPAVAIPEEAVQMVEGRASVFVPVPGEENTFARRDVVVGAPVGGLVPVHSGLVEGERFVAAGTFILKAELGKGGAEHTH